MHLCQAHGESRRQGVGRSDAGKGNEWRKLLISWLRMNSKRLIWVPLGKNMCIPSYTDGVWHISISINVERKKRLKKGEWENGKEVGRKEKRIKGKGEGGKKKKEEGGNKKGRTGGRERKKEGSEIKGKFHSGDLHSFWQNTLSKFIKGQILKTKKSKQVSFYIQNHD